MIGCLVGELARPDEIHISHPERRKKTVDAIRAVPSMASKANLKRQESSRDGETEGIYDTQIHSGLMPPKASKQLGYPEFGLRGGLNRQKAAQDAGS